MAWRFGDTFDHYTDLLTKYDAIGTAQGIGLGTGRFNTNSCRFTGAGGYVRKTVGAASAYGAFATLAGSFQRTSAGRVGFLNLWSGTRGHLVFARDDDGSITVHRQTGNEAPLDSSGPVVASTAAGVWPVNGYSSIEVAALVHATNGAVYLRVNGVSLVAVVGVPTANPNAAGWDGWYVGTEKSVGLLDVDDLMIYDDQNTGDGVQTFLGDLTGECVVPQASYQEAWTNNTGGPNWAAVREIPPDNDVTYIEAGIVQQGDYYQMTRLARVSQGIRAVQVVITARKTGSPLRSIAALVVDSGVNYVGPSMPLTVGYKAAITPRPLASWGGYWTMDQVNAASVGLVLVA
jgi:hypothetical protein